MYRCGVCYYLNVLEAWVEDVWAGGFEKNVLFLNIFLCIARWLLQCDVFGHLNMILKTGVKLSSVIFLCVFCTSSLEENLLAVVVFNGEKLTGHFNNATLLRSSFEKIPSISKTNNSLKFVFFDLNSTVCDYRKFLSFFANGERDIRQFALAVVIESCSCERQLSRFFHQLGVKVISSCEEPVILTVGISLNILNISVDATRRRIVLYK